MGNGNKELYKLAKGFDHNPQNINRKGRPRKLVGTVIKSMEQDGIKKVSRSQIAELFETLLNCTEEDLELMSNDMDQPMLNRIVATSMLDKKGFEIVEKIIDRVHGKAIENTDTVKIIVKQG